MSAAKGTQASDVHTRRWPIAAADQGLSNLVFLYNLFAICFWDCDSVMFWI